MRPTNRTLVLIAVIVTPLLLLAGISSQSAALASCVVLLAFAGILIFDWYLYVKRPATVVVDHPKTLRLTVEEKRSMPTTVRVDRPIKSVRVGVAWPSEAGAELDTQSVKFQSDHTEQLLNWELVPTTRGAWDLDCMYAETPSPLGFWWMRQVVPTEMQIRVYPSLASERQTLGPVLMRQQSLGNRLVRQVGQGREFEKLRDYVPGDGFGDIHWKGTAKRGRPVTKVYQIERTQEIYIILDASRLSGRSVQTTADVGEGKPVLERLIQAALVLSLAVEREGDLIGMCTFSDQIHDFIRAKRGHAHYQTIRNALAVLQTQAVTPDYEELFAFLRTRLRRRALLIFLTALDDPVISESFVDHVHLLSRQHLLLVNMVSPAGVAPMYSDAAVKTSRDLYGALAGHHRWAGLAEIEQVLGHQGIDFHLLSDVRLSATLIQQYLTIKQRQLI